MEIRIWNWNPDRWRIVAGLIMDDAGTEPEQSNEDGVQFKWRNKRDERRSITTLWNWHSTVERKKRTMDYINPLLIIIVTDKKNDGTHYPFRKRNIDGRVGHNGTVPGGLGGRASGNCPPQKKNATEVRDPARKDTHVQGGKRHTRWYSAAQVSRTSHMEKGSE